MKGKGNWGGPRPGAGRPLGTGHKPKITDDITDEQKELLLAKAIQEAMGGKQRVLVFLLEQIYGKALQSVDLDPNDLGMLKKIKIELVKPKNNDTDTPPEAPEQPENKENKEDDSNTKEEEKSQEGLNNNQ